MRVVVDYDVDRLQVYNGDIKPSSTNCPNLFLKKFFCISRLRRRIATFFQEGFSRNLDHLVYLDHLDYLVCELSSLKRVNALLHSLICQPLIDNDQLSMYNYQRAYGVWYKLLESVRT